jgi:hypothetical protein
MSQEQSILAHLERGNTITPLEALNMFGCFRLAARVRDLKDRGHAIACEKVEANGKRFARYRLEVKR